MHKKDDVRCYHAKAQELTEEKGAEASSEEVAKAAGLSNRRLESTIAAIAAQGVVSLESVTRFTSDIYALTPEDQYIAKETKKEIIAGLKTALEALSLRERKIVFLRFGFGEMELTQRQVGPLLNTSHTTVGNVEAAALRKIRTFLGGRGVGGLGH
ncbi:hypothetical protein HY310_02140 [Candidatus Microgenomates bacterium]|nr:hypothetical protein [Candidatus Microgenomates bacterium]